MLVAADPDEYSTFAVDVAKPRGVNAGMLLQGSNMGTYNDTQFTISNAPTTSTSYNIGTFT